MVAVKQIEERKSESPEEAEGDDKDDRKRIAHNGDDAAQAEFSLATGSFTGDVGVEITQGGRGWTAGNSGGELRGFGVFGHGSREGGGVVDE